MAKNLEKEKEEMKKNYKKSLMEAGIKAWNETIEYTLKELEEEARNMYDSFIEQYYKYKTKYYYRHNAGVGTCWGDNLYYGSWGKGDRGINIVFSEEKKGFKMYKFYTNFSGDLMAGGYEYNTPDEVLSQVMRGIRGVPELEDGKEGWWEPWIGSYNGKYFSYGGIMKKAFNCFDDNFEQLQREIFNKHIMKTLKNYIN